MTSVCFQGRPFHITVIYVQTTNAGEAEVEQFYDDLQDLLELAPRKRCPFHHRELECKSRKSRDTLKIGKFGTGVRNSRAKANQVLPRERTGIANTLF